MRLDTNTGDAIQRYRREIKTHCSNTLLHNWAWWPAVGAPVERGVRRRLRACE